MHIFGELFIEFGSWINHSANHTSVIRHIEIYCQAITSTESNSLYEFLYVKVWIFQGTDFIAHLKWISKLIATFSYIQNYTMSYSTKNLFKTWTLPANSICLPLPKAKTSKPIFSFTNQTAWLKCSFLSFSNSTKKKYAFKYFYENLLLQKSSGHFY